MLVFMIWPFTRLVHAFSAPLLYFFRPYVVYRDRGPHDQGSHAPRRGWEKIGS
jgi:nitrate reductase gamma subunit